MPNKEDEVSGGEEADEEEADQETTTTVEREAVRGQFRLAFGDRELRDRSPKREIQGGAVAPDIDDPTRLEEATEKRNATIVEALEVMECLLSTESERPEAWIHAKLRFPSRAGGDLTEVTSERHTPQSREL